MNTQEILNIIRDRCGLKKLEFGCVCRGLYASERNPDRDYYFTGQTKNHIGNGVSIKTGREVNYAGSPMPDGSESIEIIGLPVHLEHLLMAIDTNTVGIDAKGIIEYVGRYDDRQRKEITYDFKKSVEQNLEDNPELRELVANLLK